MKCPFCAEEIQAEAILCRFCGAVKRDQVWVAPEIKPDIPRATPINFGRLFTIRTAAIFFLISAGFELFGLNNSIPLWGAMRSGAIATIYHLANVVWYLAIGVGLWLGRRWGFSVAVAGTVYYTLERGLYLADHAARSAELQQQLGAYGELSTILDTDSVLQLMNLFSVLIIVCWWGFLAYLWLNRGYFRRA